MLAAHFCWFSKMPATFKRQFPLQRRQNARAANWLSLGPMAGTCCQPHHSAPRGPVRGHVCNQQSKLDLGNGPVKPTLAQPHCLIPWEAAPRGVNLTGKGEEDDSGVSRRWRRIQGKHCNKWPHTLYKVCGISSEMFLCLFASNIYLPCKSSSITRMYKIWERLFGIRVESVWLV